MEENHGRLPAEYVSLAGIHNLPSGPYYKDDTAKFAHGSREAQEWFLRLSKEDVERLEYSIRVGFWVQTGLKWGRWGCYAFTGGLSAALAAGEKLEKLSSMMSGALSSLQGLFL